MTQRIDAVTAAVIQGALDNIAIEMGHKLMRMSYSSIIRESEDFGAALTDETGRQLCECTFSTPLQSGPIPGYIRNIIEVTKARGDELREGDVIMHNDPYGGASHGPDVAFAIPVFAHGKLVGFSATTAHHLDIGAQTPGSCGIVEAVDTYSEGLQFKAIKVYDAGRRNDAVWYMLNANIRAPHLVVGDMEAQIKAARIGAERYKILIEKYGEETFRAACEDLMDYSEKLMRDAIAELPDGEYSATTYIDGYMDDFDPGRRALPICATVKIEGDKMIVDLTGTAKQVDDRPINMPFVGTTDCAVWLTVRSILLDAVDYGAIPQNAGLTRAIEIVAPKGCLANPTFPAPVIARFCPGNQLADTVMKALAQIVPEKVSAGIGNLRIVALSGLEQSNHWVHMEIMEGAYGGRFGKDGMDAVDTLYANTRNNPIEDIESHIPVRCDRYELHDNRCVPGKWRGGVGAVREFTFLSDAGFSIEGEGHGFKPWGFDGGAEGMTASMTLVYPDGSSADLPSKVPYFKVHAGERLVCEGPCGGGYGDARERAPEAVLADVLDGLLTPEMAYVDYGVVIRNGAVDAAATAEARAA
ncbi:hydantoinase B/oxoprolinase family protein [Pseudodonghicola xiamenensis]|uniref:5-oxoprolinase n=1 Tax=Pseudodonghicola xiamenensis TaxID=337702 RepID=A0A8J3MF73_9RHOB|nr:hydantoinase B/oxoprolinase family protein [Pseudodonghicola xiamenensis]GHH02477.1 5-oxoprolinase [Pseudodonghicola xiamenensis]